jgi:POT family proton-dependent oligopeptide transporter
MFFAGLSFSILAVAESIIASGGTPSILWQFWAYVILTAGEVMVSITGLEFSYTQAPNSMKSFIMGLWFLSVSLGNGFTAIVNQLIVNPDGTYKLDSTEYFWFFAIVMAVTAVLFIFVASRYKEENYIQTRDALPNPLLTEN